MAGSVFGNLFQISTWGESHGKGIGVVVDGCPAGLTIDESIIQTYLNRRKPGASKYATPRKESDQVEILSGIFEGKTTGTPISMLVRNESQRSKDYSEIASYYRPGHADYTFDAKYGFRDYRGGGRSSGRETIGRVAGGAVALELLKTLGIHITAYTKSIGPVVIDPSRFDQQEIQNNVLCMPDAVAAKEASLYLDQMLKEQDSVGGIIECVISGMPAGIGEPVFDKLDALLAQAIMSIGAVKGIEIGDGFAVSSHLGSNNNDSFFYDEEKVLHKRSNHAGGILGGISDGSDIILRAAIKPTPSIYKTQETVNKEQNNIDINIKGRHDPIIVPRAVVVVEAMTALTITDLLFRNMTATLDGIEQFYHKK
ncbi:chorismate synthase [Lachnospiraceae bacterium KM106-2]|nr:chorismate synthase [Lachnospiraceae bacterium KM106-2]